jgi:restriction system protein
MRFRKRIKIAKGVNLNFSKSGLSTTFRIAKGLSINTGKRGTYINSGIPGTGLYSRKKISSESPIDVPQINTFANTSNSISNGENRRKNWIWLLGSFLLLATGNAIAIIAALIIILWLNHKFFKWLRLKSKKSPRAQMVYSLAIIDQMDGYQFERCMLDIYKRLGYSVEHTPLSGDQGADLIITSNEGIRTAVQCKRYSNKISNKAVQEVVASKAVHRCTSGLVVTNNYFTDSAKQLANANHIGLVDRAGLQKIICEISKVQPYNDNIIGEKLENNLE